MRVDKTVPLTQVVLPLLNEFMPDVSITSLSWIYKPLAVVSVLRSISSISAMRLPLTAPSVVPTLAMAVRSRLSPDLWWKKPNTPWPML